MSPTEMTAELYSALRTAWREVERTGKPVHVGVFFMGMSLVLHPVEAARPKVQA